MFLARRRQGPGARELDRSRRATSPSRSGRGFEPERVPYLLGLVLKLHLDAKASDFLEHDEHLVLPALDVAEELVDAQVGEIPNLVSRATLDDAEVGGEGGGVPQDVVDGDAGLVLGRGAGGGVLRGGVRARGESAARATRGETRPSEAPRRGDARDARARPARDAPASATGRAAIAQTQRVADIVFMFVSEVRARSVAATRAMSASDAAHHHPRSERLP